MGAIEDIYDDLDADISEEEFRAAVEEKVEQLGGLADEETAAMLIAHELTDEEINGIADIEPGMEEVQFLGKVVSIGELREFERDDDEDEPGRVVNVEVADETGTVPITFWDDRAEAAVDELETGAVLRIEGRPRDGYNGLEVSVNRAEPEPDADIDVDLTDEYTIEELALGRSNVNLRGKVLATESVRTFDRDDGSEGRVSNLVLGDETGRIRVTLWDEMADRVETLAEGQSIEVVDGYVRERDGDLELHVGDRGTIEELDEDVTYVPDSTPIEAVEIDQTVDLAGVVRSADPKRTFDRDDGSEGQVRNIRVQDDTGDIRVALWGEKADREVTPGDRVQLADVEIQDGWQDDLEASAGWRSTLTILDSSAEAASPAESGDETDPSLSSFGGDDDPAPDSTADSDDAASTAAQPNLEEVVANETVGDDEPAATATTADDPLAREDEGPIEFTGVVVQASDPVVLDDGEKTVSVDTDARVQLGEEITVRGPIRDGRIDAAEVR
ncbi:MAG: single-stranded DNA binding protein [Halobacteriales archaeon]|nr:single-stranded DNA binding protein [Halobacteriales archaeon]